MWGRIAARLAVRRVLRIQRAERPHRRGFHVAVNAPEADEAERRLLADLGYRAVLAAAATDASGRWLVELFGDERTPPMNEHLPLLRALVSHAVASAPRAPR